MDEVKMFGIYAPLRVAEGKFGWNCAGIRGALKLVWKEEKENGTQQKV